MYAYDEDSNVLSDAIQSQIQLNGKLHKKIADNDVKYENFLQELQEIKNGNDEAGKLLPAQERLCKLENEAKTAAIERKILNCRLNDSTTQLKKLLYLCNENKQYMMRENLLLKGLQNVPTWLKGYKFSMWVAHVLNCLIPNLDFPIQPQHISVSHPLYKDANGTTVIIRFALRDVRNEIFYKKQYITNRYITITEHLIKSNQDLLTAATDLVGPKHAWSSQTNIFGKVGEKIVKIQSFEDIEKLRMMKKAVTPESTRSERPINIPTPPVMIDDHNESGTVSNVDPTNNPNPTNDASLLMQSYPSLSQADLITAIKDFELKRNNKGRERGYQEQRPRENWDPSNSRGRGTNHRASFSRRGRTQFRPFF